LRSFVFCKYDSRQADRKTERLDTMKTDTQTYRQPRQQPIG
jgi:hypothetical protein